jgi:hypothetical protein
MKSCRHTNRKLASGRAPGSVAAFGSTGTVQEAAVELPYPPAAGKLSYNSRYSLPTTKPR